MKKQFMLSLVSLSISALCLAACGKAEPDASSDDAAVEEATSGDSDQAQEQSEDITDKSEDVKNVEQDAEDKTDGTSQVTDESIEASPFALWEYEGYVDECEGYTWKNEFKDCDYDGDGKTDRLSRTCDTDAQTAVYTIEFGNGDTLTVPQGWDTGFPHIKGRDLDSDGQNEILVTLSYDTSTDPYSFGDLWLFHRDGSLGEYSEVKLPLASGENGARCLTIDYDAPDGNTIHYSIKEADFSNSEEVDVDYISNWWTTEKTTELRPVYWAEIKEKSTPVIRCYVEPLVREGKTIGFDLFYNNGAYEITDIDYDSSTDY